MKMDPHARNNSGSKSPVDDGMAHIDALVVSDVKVYCIMTQCMYE